MGIVADDIERVRNASDLVAIAGEHIALKKVGRRYQGLCPFHTEKTASFSVNPELNLFHCFGCQKGGDVITFVREINHLDFVGAVELLAARAGVELHYDDAAVSPDRARRARLADAVAKAVAWYHERLLTSPDAAAARAYLRSRGYDGDVVRAYSIGWAPDDWDALARALALPDDVLRDSGLGFVNRRGRQQDAFRARVLFPIFDARGDAVALGGRILPGGEGPKYKNSQEGPLYSKSKVLYGLNWAKDDIVRSGEVVVCEGYTDVIAVASAGMPRAVATCGTALTEDHVRLLKNFAPRVVLAYDADAAGQAAADRFYDWEKRYELDIVVAALPAGKDPGDVAKDDPSALRAAVEHARPFLGFRVERVLQAADLRTPEHRARAADAALGVIAEHPDAAVRDQYALEVAARCKLDAATLRARAAGGAARPIAPARTRDRLPAEEHPSPELEALKLAVHQRDSVDGRLHEVLFAEPLYAAAWRSLAASASIHEAIAGAHPDVGVLLGRLAVEECEDDPDDVVARLVHEAARRSLRELETEAAVAVDPLEYAEVVAWLQLTIEQLSDPALVVHASDVLLAWLMDRQHVEAQQAHGAGA